MKRRDFVIGLGTLAAGLWGGFPLSADKAHGQSVVTDRGSNHNRGKKMKITVITGSPHKNGTSALLADKFIEGAQKSGHDVYRFNAAFEEVHPCTGCDRCGMEGPCIYKDAMNQLLPKLLAADLIAFVTPLYYYGMSAQLKTVIDRFYSNNSSLHVKKKAVLMATAYNTSDWTMQALTAHYKTLLRYMGWEDAGMVLATGCGVRSAIERTDFPNQAYRLGLRV